MNNVIILGCARSGTSILGEFFECFPEYDYRFEPVLPAGDFAAAFAGAGRPLAIKRPKLPHGSTDTTTPGFAFDWPRLAAAFPQPYVVIWIVRHPFDTICSLRPGILADWNHSPRPPEWRQLQELPWEVRCATHWTNINGIGFQIVREQARIIHYEELVAAPLAAARRIGGWIGWLDGLPPTIDAWAASVGNNKGASAYEARVQSRWSETNHQIRVGRHRENLDDAQRNRIRPIVAAAAASFGYQLDDDA